jgi:DNA processing protein
MEYSELAAWLRLTLTQGVGNHTARRLLARCGLPHNIFSQPALWRDLVSEAQARALGAEPAELPALLESTWAWLQQGTGELTHAVITLADPAYPQALLATEDPPILLYACGKRDLLESGAPFPTTRCLAMVGSRNPTVQGAENARHFARALQEAGMCIVSGLALGIDAAAHEGALDGHTEKDPVPATIAVVGTGLDRVYPSRHHDLAHRIAQQGLLVSEYPLGTPPIAANFPKRNRIIAGLSQGTLVVEAALQSGSLITARLASEQGREVFAIPGSIHAPQSRGCHALIRQGAKLVETIQDVLEELHLPTPPALADTPSASEAAGEEHTHPSKACPHWAALGHDPIALDTLIARTGLSASAWQVWLLERELDGDVSRLPGGLFQRVVRS